jgi:hypothetical protein
MDSRHHLVGVSITMKAWLETHKAVTVDDIPRLCNDCPCVVSDCQCVFHAYALWYEAPVGSPPPWDVSRWVTVAEVNSTVCTITPPVTALHGSTYVFVGDGSGDGCYDLLGNPPAVESTWVWCQNPGSWCVSPGRPTYLATALWNSNYPCTPCDDTMTGCTPPAAAPSLPPNFWMLPNC